MSEFNPKFHNASLVEGVEAAEKKPTGRRIIFEKPAEEIRAKEITTTTKKLGELDDIEKIRKDLGADINTKETESLTKQKIELQEKLTGIHLKGFENGYTAREWEYVGTSPDLVQAVDLPKGQRKIMLDVNQLKDNAEKFKAYEQAKSISTTEAQSEITPEEITTDPIKNEDELAVESKIEEKEQKVPEVDPSVSENMVSEDAENKPSSDQELEQEVKIAEEHISKVPVLEGVTSDEDRIILKENEPQEVLSETSQGRVGDKAYRVSEAYRPQQKIENKEVNLFDTKKLYGALENMLIVFDARARKFGGFDIMPQGPFDKFAELYHFMTEKIIGKEATKESGKIDFTVASELNEELIKKFEDAVESLEITSTEGWQGTSQQEYLEDLNKIRDSMGYMTQELAPFAKELENGEVYSGQGAHLQDLTGKLDSLTNLFGGKIQSYEQYTR